MDIVVDFIVFNGYYSFLLLVSDFIELLSLQ